MPDLSRLGVLGVACAILLGAPQLSQAQPSGRIGVAGTLEYARITEDDGYLGAGLGGSGGVQFHLTDATSVEIEVGWERHIRDLGRFAVAFDAHGQREVLPYTERWEGTAKFVLGVVSHAFGSAPVRPVVWGGIGLMSHGGTSRGPLASPQVPPGFTLQQGDAEMRRGRGSEALSIDGGGGVEARLTERLTLRPFVGLRLVSTGNVGPKYIIRSGGRVGFRW